MIPKGPYSVIYADPPWDFRTYSAKGDGRSANQHYSCLNLEDIKSLPILESAADDCALFLWVTGPFLERAFEVIDAWGFAYKSVAFTWAKLNKRARGSAFSRGDFSMGCGYWTRANSEQCLLATRGKPKRLSRGVRQLVVAPRREHSRKPDEIYDRIEALVSGPYLELFARSVRTGWDAWGNEIDRFGSASVGMKDDSATCMQPSLPLPSTLIDL